MKIERIGQVFWDNATLAGGEGGSDPIGDAITSSISEAGGIQSDTPAPAPAVTPPTTEDAAEEAELARLEQEILGKNPTMKGGKMDVPRHQAVLTRHRNQWTAKEKEYQTAKEKYEKDLAEWKRYEWAKDPQLQEALQALALAESDQKGFVDYLLQDPRFASLIAYKDQAPPKPEGGPRPGPNAPDGNGGFYYDDKGLEALLAWERQQTLVESRKENEKAQKEWEARYKPIAEEHEARNAWNRSLSEGKQTLENSRANWPGFKEYEPLIKKAMTEHEEWDLKDAYIMTVPQQQQGKYNLDREKIRQELIAEMNGKKGAVQTVKPGVSPERQVDANADVDLADVIRQAIAQSQR